jgi:hypothetical protein
LGLYSVGRRRYLRGGKLFSAAVRLVAREHGGLLRSDLISLCGQPLQVRVDLVLEPMMLAWNYFDVARNLFAFSSREIDQRDRPVRTSTSLRLMSLRLGLASRCMSAPIC